MNIGDLLLQQPEGKQLEFKRDLSSPQNALKTLVAFANSAGGRLVIGVDDARRVAGVADPLAEEERICNLITDSIAPRLIPNVELMSIGDATVLIVEVFPSSATRTTWPSRGWRAEPICAWVRATAKPDRTGLRRPSAPRPAWCLTSNPCPS